MALGGVLVVVALIGTGVYLRKAEAETDSPKKEVSAPLKATPAPAPAPPPAPAPTAGTATQVPAPPAAPPTAAPSTAAVSGAVTQPGARTATPVNVRPRASGRSANSAEATSSNGPGPEPATASGTARDSESLDQLEQEIDGLSARAGAVNNSLDRLQQEQARQGLGLRGDMAARQQSMNLNLTKAERAVEQHDAARARKYRDLAQSDIEALEQFLGR